MSPLLETHAWIWWLQGDEGLTPRERSSLDERFWRQRSCRPGNRDNRSPFTVRRSLFGIRGSQFCLLPPACSVPLW